MVILNQNLLKIIAMVTNFSFEIKMTVFWPIIILFGLPYYYYHILPTSHIQPMNLNLLSLTRMQIDEGINILSPELRNVNGSIYRVLCPRPMCNGGSAPQQKRRGLNPHADPYKDEPNTCEISRSEAASAKQDWTTVEIPTPSFFHKHIVGRSASVKKRLENETGTQIDVPRPHENKDFIRVRYQSEDSLSSLQIRVESIVENARKREKPTHFICIPVQSEAIAHNLTKFKDLCKEDIPARIVQIPSKLHLTIGVLKLFCEKEVNQAREALTEFAPQIPYILCGKPLRGTLKNLEIMNDEPHSVRVLYAELFLLDKSERLQNLADQCFQFFVDKGLMTLEQNRNRQSVKIHCTLVNTRWARDNQGPVDASHILSEDFELQNLGDCVLERLDLNEMTVDRNKIYKTVSTVSLV